MADSGENEHYEGEERGDWVDDQDRRKRGASADWEVEVRVFACCKLFGCGLLACCSFIRANAAVVDIHGLYPIWNPLQSFPLQ